MVYIYTIYKWYNGINGIYKWYILTYGVRYICLLYFVSESLSFLSLEPDVPNLQTTEECAG